MIEEILAALIEMFPTVIKYIQAKLAKGENPNAQLLILMAEEKEADLAADAAENAKFGPEAPTNPKG